MTFVGLTPVTLCRYNGLRGVSRHEETQGGTAILADDKG